jgi:predicted transcriptional regulator
VIASDIINSEAVFVTPNDTLEKVSDLLALYNLRHINVVDGNLFIGILSEDEILLHDEGIKVNEIKEHILRVSVRPSDHLFDVLARMNQYQLTNIPVVNQETYLGSIVIEDMMKSLAELLSVNQTGCILQLQVSRYDYSLATIARIVESEGAKILSSVVREDSLNDKLLISIKTNTLETARLVATFERYDYVVSATYNDEGYQDILKDRYDSLLNYLNI